LITTGTQLINSGLATGREMQKYSYNSLQQYDFAHHKSYTGCNGTEHGPN